MGLHHYRIDRLVEDMTGLLRALRVDEPAHVMGHDRGAAVTWRLAMTRPDRVRSVVAI